MQKLFPPTFPLPATNIGDVLSALKNSSRPSAWEEGQRTDDHILSRGLTAEAKQEALSRDIVARHVDIGLQETKMMTPMDRLLHGVRIVTFKSDNRARGIGFAVSSRLHPFLSRAWQPANERIAVAEFKFPLSKGDTFELRVINVFAPTLPSSLQDQSEREPL